MTKKWKRIAALSSAVVMATATLSYFPSDTLQNIPWEITASAETTTEPQVWIEDNLTWKLYEDGTLNISGTGAMKDYNSDDSPATQKKDNVKTVVIEDGVTSIGGFAFWNCTNLTSITIPNSVTSIKSAAFYGCSSLTSITIPDSVTSIGDYAFFGCSSLTSITIPNSVTSIKSAAFYGCSSLTSITIPDSVTSIGDYAFELCNNLTSITIPDGVTSIGDYAFFGCSSLTSITIPDGVTSIGGYAFGECRSLTSITIPDSVTSIGESAFKSCSSLKTISLSCKSTLKKSDFGEQADLVSYTPHTLTKTEAKAATCTENGNKEYWTCEHCGKHFLSDDTNPETATAVELSETVTPASHKLTKVEAKAATCTENGNKEYWTCEHCGKYFLSDDTNPETATAVEQSETVIPASHELTKVEAKAATCTEDGNKEYWTCEHCKKYFLSDDTNPETATAVEQSETILPALKHKNAIIRNASEPTETKPGYSGDRYCPDCNTVLEKGYTYWIEDNLTWKLYEDGTLNISGTGAMKDYDYSNNKSPAYNRSDVTSIVIEESVTSIGDYAFESCDNLTSITIPENVEIIGEGAFYNCYNLKDVTIQDGVKSIGDSAFIHCSSLEHITIPNSITTIGEYAFYNCSSLTSITIPNSVTSIKYCTFYNCSNLTSITISDSVTSIGNAAFRDCSSLTSITIPDSVTSIGNDAFYGCQNLTSITIPDGVTSIGYYAFYGCSSLASITIPDSVTSIRNYAFGECSNLKTISLSCKSTLKRNDFGEQADLVSYTPHTLTKTESKDVTCAENGNKEYWTCKHCGKYFLSDDTNPETAKAVEQSEIILPASHKLTKVEAKAATCADAGNKEYWTCKHCGKYFLSDDTNPETAKAVEQSETVIPALKHKNAELRNASEPTETEPGYSGDRYCPDCDTVVEKGYTYWIEDNLTWKLYEDGTLNISGTGAMKDYNSTDRSPVFRNNGITSIVIEEGVTSIGAYAFSGCEALTSITIPDSVTSIGNYAFYYCIRLTSITIPDGVTSIGENAFYYCINLTNITIPDSVTSIGRAAFLMCSRLTSITIPDGVTSIENDTFNGCESLTSITIPDGVTSIGEFAFQSCSSLTSITIPDGVTSIENDTFSGCSSLTSITIPDGVTSIGDGAFYRCSGLTSITIPDSVTSIGAYAFESCSSLKTISLSCKSALERAAFGEQADLVSYTPHTLTKVEAKDVTCAENGNKEYWTCEHCGKYFLSDDTNPETATAVEQSEIILPASHELTKVEAKAATCTEDGNKEYWTCEHCGKYFLSDDTNPETATAVEQSETILPALKHKNAIIRNASEPTETDPGYSGDRYCPDCDTVLEKGYTYWIEDNLTWKLYEDGTLNIGGTGAMKDYNDDDNQSPVFKNDTIKSVVIEDGVTSIGDSAFYGCNDLTSIIIPDSVTSIGDHAFDSCSSLTSITIPDGVISIGEGAFGKCNDLTDIYYPDTKMKWKKISIGENAISPDVTIHFVEPATTIYGDVNLDGKVDILDSVFLNKYLATLVQFSDVQAANADCCQDDVLDEKDARALTRFVILLIDDLPIPPTQE